MPDHENNASVFLGKGDGVLGVSLFALVVFTLGHDIFPVDLSLIARNGGDQMHEEDTAGKGLVTEVGYLELLRALSIAPV